MAELGIGRETARAAATRRRLIAAAIQCFERDGVTNAKMEDVAAAADMTRQTVYRLFGDRSALIREVISERIRLFGQGLFSYFQSGVSAEEALIDGFLLCHRAAVSDGLLMELVREQGDHELEKFIFRGSDDARRVMDALWTPLLNEARAKDRLRDASNDQIIDWIRNIHGVFFLRGEDYPEAEMRQYLRVFLLPSVVKGY